MRALQQVCSPACGIALAQVTAAKKKEKEYQKVTRERKEKLKTRGDYLKECQIAFNAFIRLRDKDEPCISCGRYHTGQYHAGHFRSVGSAPECRFMEVQVYKQCSPCNNNLSGNLIEYRKNLVKKLGVEMVEWIEGNHEMPKLTIEQIKDLTKYYRQKARELKDA
jgi:hypothetical protein